MKAKESQRANALALEVAELRQQLIELQSSEKSSPAASDSHQTPRQVSHSPSHFHQSLDPECETICKDMAQAIILR